MLLRKLQILPLKKQRMVRELVFFARRPNVLVVWQNATRYSRVSFFFGI